MASHACCLSVCTLPSAAQAFARYHKRAGDEEYALLQYGAAHPDIDGPGLMQARAADWRVGVVGTVQERQPWRCTCRAVDDRLAAAATAPMCNAEGKPP